MNIKEMVFWTKNRLFRRSSYNAYKEALLFDSLSAEQKSKIEFENQKKIVEYAYNHVKYYREYYDSKGFNPSMLVSPRDWDRVPVLEKNVIRENHDQLLSDEFSTRDLLVSTTSGSTGTPMMVYKNKDVPYEVMGWRAFKWWNLDPSDNVGILHRRAPKTFMQWFKNRALWWPTKRIYIDACTFSNDDIGRFVGELAKGDIKWLQGYCVALEAVADYIINNGVIIEGLKMVWSTSAVLTPFVRKKMEKAFRCSVMDQYGSCEIWNIAIQKKDEPFLTICTDYAHVDIVDENGRECGIGAEGDVLVTDLCCTAFPLIRYRIGDRSSIAKTCEQSEDGYPKLNFVQGRTVDYIYKKDGERIDSAFFAVICDAYLDNVNSFQVYQRLDYSIVFKIEFKPGKKDDDIVNTLYSEIVKAVDRDIEVNVEVVPYIEGYKGKKRYIISEVAMNLAKTQNP